MTFLLLRLINTLTCYWSISCW